MMHSVLHQTWSHLLRSDRVSLLVCISALLTVSLGGICSDRAIAAEPTPSRKSDLVKTHSNLRAANLTPTLTMTCDVVTLLMQHPQCPIGGGVSPGESWFTADRLQLAQEVRLMPYQAVPQPEQLTVISAPF
ncbi:MAG TPA: hypothetical protein V6C64_16200 [Microcoleaceae cyanobacterium]